MVKFNKLLNILLLSLMGITLVMLALFFLGGEVEGAALSTPIFTESFINWGIILIVLAAVVTIFVEVANIVLQPKKAKRTLASVGILLVLIFVSYLLADGTPMHLEYVHPDNVPYWLKFSDIFIFTAYFVFGIAIVALLYTELSRAFRK